MSSDEATLADGVEETIDIDRIIRAWGAEKLGSEVDKVDTSQVNVSQLSVIYQSNKDWFCNVQLHSEIFDNPHEEGDSTWRYSHAAKFKSQATWRITKGYNTHILPTLRLAVDFPVAEEGKRPLRGTFEKSNAGQTAEAKGVEVEWAIEKEVNVKPLTTTKATAEVRVCRLKDVKFSTDIVVYGLIKLHASSKRMSKIGKGSEVSASIVEVLGSNPAFTTLVEQQAVGVENSNDSYGVNNKKVCFRVEGTCAGEVGLGASVRLSEVQSLV